MALGLREIADILLKDIYQTIGEDDTLEMHIIFQREEYAQFGNKVHLAADYLEEIGLITGEKAEDEIFDHVSLTTQGVLYCEKKRWKQNKEDATTELKTISISLREISILLLEKLGKLHEKDPYTTGFDFNEILNSEELKTHHLKIKDAALFLEEDEYAKCYLSNDNSIYAIGITQSGKRRLEQRQVTITKPTEIEIIIKDLISESNPDRPRDMELTKTNEFYNKINELGDSNTKINFLQDILTGIEDFFIKKWTKGKRPGNYINGYPINFWKKTIKEYSLYIKIRSMIEKLVDDPKYYFSNYYKDIFNVYKDLDKLRIEQAMERKKYWEEHLFIDILEIKEYLKTLQTADEKIEFLDYKLHELIQICYHYTDDNIEKILKKQRISEKFKRVKYSPMTDFSHNHISKSEYIFFLTLLNKNIKPFMRSELRRLKSENIESQINNGEIENEDIEEPETIGIAGTPITITHKYPYILTEITGWYIKNTKHNPGQVIDLTKSEFKEYSKSIKIEPYGMVWKQIINELQEYNNYTDKINCLKKVKAKFEFDKAYPTGNNTFINYINERLAEYIEKQTLLDNENTKVAVKSAENKSSIIKPIVWLGTKKQLLQLFKMLSDSEIGYIPEYTEMEILQHFIDQRGNKFIDEFCIKFVKLTWKDTDGKFWELVNQLVDINFIYKQKKYQTFITHFLNSEFQEFKNPAQTNFFKKNFLNPDKNISDIISKLLLIKD